MKIGCVVSQDCGKWACRELDLVLELVLHIYAVLGKGGRFLYQTTAFF